MSELRKIGVEFVGYEYQEKVVSEGMVSLYLDSYPCFGWDEDENFSGRVRIVPGKKQSLRFRRERKICNKAELTRLQRNFDGCVSEIENMEKTGKTIATAWTVAMGVTGTVFMACATFAVVGETPDYVLSSFLAVPGFAGWIAPGLFFRKLSEEKERKLKPIIEQKYEEIYEICRKGRSLII